MQRIVVGVDGSDASRRGLALAIDVAERRGGQVDAVLVHHRPAFFDAPLPGMAPGQHVEAAALVAKTAQATLDEVVDTALRGRSTTVTVQRLSVEGAVANTLLETARGADLLVVGSRGRGGFPGLLLGSVSQHVVTHASCPAIVVPRDWGPADSPERPRVVVGVDGSPGARAALDWAAAEARSRGARLHAVAVFLPPMAAWGFGEVAYVPPVGIDEVRAATSARLEEQLAQAGVDGDLPVHQEVVQGAPAHRLLRASEGADLLVVGTRGHGGVSGLLLGSVGQQCVHHAVCPVAVVRSIGTAKVSPTHRD